MVSFELGKEIGKDRHFFFKIIINKFSDVKYEERKV